MKNESWLMKKHETTNWLPVDFSKKMFIQKKKIIF